MIPPCAPSASSPHYVARALGYNNTTDWMANDAATIAAASPDHFMAICSDIARAGFESIDIWTAHALASPQPR